MNQQQKPPLPNPNDFHWDDEFLLGYTPMDETHREFVSCVRSMLDAPDSAFIAALEAFADHAQRHFNEEYEWMTSTDFPATDCHVQEHESVLQSVQEVRLALAGDGDLELGRRLARELALWFPGHADYMDAALSHWLNKKSHGGVPVVLRRSLANT